MKLLVIVAIVTLFTSLHAKTLRVLTRNAPTTFFYGADGHEAGFEYDLISAFAKERGYTVHIDVKNSVDEVLHALNRGEGDFAAVGLSKTDKRAQKFYFSYPYYRVKQQVVCAYNVRPKSVEDLERLQLQIIKNSSYVETLSRLKKVHKTLHWSEHEGYTTEHIFDLLDKKRFDCTLADSNIVAINRRYFPYLHVAFDVSRADELVWLFSKKVKNRALREEINSWLQSFVKRAAYRHVVDRYFAHVAIFDYVDIAKFHKKIATTLPKYRASFMRGAKKYGLDWRVIAAQAYQESHWNPYAKSPTGVRGMMMITLSTAKELGVSNRLNYRYAIEGGCKYMQRLKKRIPKEVTSQASRYKYALVAYNMGMGHLYDAIRLGKKLGIDPYHWSSFKTLLPKLSERKYFKSLKYGYARGSEALKYVERINNYYDILKQYYPQK